MLAALAPAVIFIATAVERSYQTDFWHHLARGRAIVTEGRIVNEDQFTYTVHGEALRDANWLTQVFYYLLYRQGGLELVQFVNSLALAAMMALVVAQCRRASGSLALATAIGVITFLGLWRLLVIRPQTFSLLLFALLYTILDRADHRRWLLILPPIVMALWVNMHGGFPIGFILIGAFFLAALGEAIWGQGWGFVRNGSVWALASCLVASGLATLANPYGWEVYQYVGTTSNRASARGIQEWLPPGLNLFVSQMWVLSVVVVVAFLVLPWRRPTSRELVLVLIFLALACGAVRMAPWWWIVVAPILASQLSASLPRALLQHPAPQQPSLTTAVLCLLLLGAVVLSVPGMDRYVAVPGLSKQLRRTEDDLEAVAQHLRKTPGRGGRIFCRLEWAEYLEWSLAPDGYTIFMDGRIEIYPDQLWDEYMAATHGRWDSLQILDRHQVDYLILDADSPEQRDNLIPLVEQSSVKWEECRMKPAGSALVFARVAPTGTRR